MYEESDRLGWKDVFGHKIFEEAIKLQLNNEPEIVPSKNNM